MSFVLYRVPLASDSGLTEEKSVDSGRFYDNLHSNLSCPGWLLRIILDPYIFTVFVIEEPLQSHAHSSRGILRDQYPVKPEVRFIAGVEIDKTETSNALARRFPGW